MTLCIGALARVEVGLSSCIVLCFDTKVGNEAFGSEGEYKFHLLSNQLVCLVAGKPGRAKELAVIYESHLKSVKLTEDNLMDALRGPLQVLKRRLANAYIGRKLGVSYEDLLQNGERWFGKDTVEKYRSDIENNDLGVQMIFAGFAGEIPLLCELRDGEIERVTNFCLIGTGAYTAEPALHAREQTRNTFSQHALYNCYEAKRIGESSPFVGAETRILIIHPADEDSRIISALK